MEGRQSAGFKSLSFRGATGALANDTNTIAAPKLSRGGCTTRHTILFTFWPQRSIQQPFSTVTRLPFTRSIDIIAPSRCASCEAIHTSLATDIAAAGLAYIERRLWSRRTCHHSLRLSFYRGLARASQNRRESATPSLRQTKRVVLGSPGNGSTRKTGPLQQVSTYDVVKVT